MDLLEESAFTEEGGSRRRRGETGGDQSAPARCERPELLNLTLHQCAQSGNEENLQDVLRRLGSNAHTKINDYDNNGLTPLHYAARYHHLAVARTLMDKGADVNVVSKGEVTALHLAARYNTTTDTDDTAPRRRQSSASPRAEEESVVEYLLSQGASVNSPDSQNQTPLHYAASRGTEQSCRHLLEAADVNIEAEDNQGLTPLHTAVIHNQLHAARLLLDKGAKLSCKDKEQTTPLHYACAEGNVAMVNLLFGAVANAPKSWLIISEMVVDSDKRGSTCLHHAVDRGHHEVVKILIDKRAEVNRPREYNTFGLHQAASLGDVQMADLLMRHGASVDAEDESQCTPLHRAASLNHVQVAKLLIDSKADVNKKDRNSNTALMLAVKAGHVKLVKLLMDAKAQVNVTDTWDNTVLHMAAQHNKPAVMEAVLTHSQGKQLINAYDQNDDSPLHVAAQLGHLDIVKALINSGADMKSRNKREQTPIHLAAHHGHTSVVEEIVNTSMSAIREVDGESNTPLHLAAQAGHDTLVLLLLRLGADAKARNYYQLTALGLAASNGWTKTCRVLLTHHSPVNPIHKDMTSPLHQAARYGHARVIELLLDWKADVTLHDDQGCTCLNLAIDKNQEEAAMSIINSAVWQEALRCAIVDPHTGHLNTPMRKLIHSMPAVAGRVLDRCWSYGKESNPEHRECEVTLNYEFLDDVYTPWVREAYIQQLTQFDGVDTKPDSPASKVDRLLEKVDLCSTETISPKANHPLFVMKSSGRKELLSHPVVTSLLEHKWRIFGCISYLMSLIIYGVFLAFLTGFIVIIKPPHNFTDSHETSIRDNSCDNQIRNTYSQTLFTQMAPYVVIFFTAFCLLKEIGQCLRFKLTHLSWTNLVEWTTYITAMVFLISFNECQRTTGYRYEWQWSLGAVSVFLAWFNLILYLRKFPPLGLYVLIFIRLLYTFLRFITIPFLFLVAFALAFYAVLGDQNSGNYQAFITVPKAMVKTLVMMYREFEFDSIFNDVDIYYPAATYIIFIIFLIVMSILLVNMLIGLAVDDIKTIQEQATLRHLGMKVELLLDAEAMMPEFIHRKVCIKEKTVKPNLHKTRNPVFRFLFTQSAVTATSLQEHLHPELKNLDKVEDTVERLSADNRRLKEDVRILQQTSQRTESMLKALLHSHKISWQHDRGHASDDD